LSKIFQSLNREKLQASAVKRAEEYLRELLNKAVLMYGEKARSLEEKVKQFVEEVKKSENPLINIARELVGEIVPPTADELALLMYLASRGQMLMERIYPMSHILLKEYAIVTEWNPYSSSTAYTTENAIVLNLPRMVERLIRAWYNEPALQGQLPTVPEGLTPCEAPLLVRPIVFFARSGLPIEKGSVEAIYGWGFPSYVTSSPFFRNLVSKFKSSISLSERLSDLLTALIELAIGTPFAFTYMHELKHALEMHVPRFQYLLNRLKDVYGSLIENPMVQQLLANVANIIEDSLINPELLIFLPSLLHAVARGLGAPAEEYRYASLGSLLYYYLTGCGLASLIHELDVADEIRRFIQQLQAQGITRIPLNSPLYRQAMELIGKLTKLPSPVEEVNLLRKLGILKALEEGRFSEAGEILEKFLQSNVYTRVGYPSTVPPIEILLLYVIEPVLKLLSMLEQVPTQSTSGTCRTFESPTPQPRGPSETIAGEEKKEGEGGGGEEEREGKEERTGSGEGERPIMSPGEVLKGAKRRARVMEEVARRIKQAGVSPVGWLREVKALKSIQELEKFLIDLFTGRGISPSEEASWSAPRIIKKLPGNVYTTSTAIFLIDTSGSIGREELERFLGAVYNLAKKRNVEPYVIFWDAMAYGPYYASTAREVIARIVKNVQGGGGTVIRPALERAYRLILSKIREIVPLIVMTDTEIADLEEEATRNALIKLSKLTYPRFWVTTYRWPPEYVLKLRFRPIRVILESQGK